MGIRAFKDTCMVVSPATERFECIAVNSTKALVYLTKLKGLKVVFDDLEGCLKRAFI